MAVIVKQRSGVCPSVCSIFLFVVSNVNISVPICWTSVCFDRTDITFWLLHQRSDALVSLLIDCDVSEAVSDIITC